MPQDTPNDVYIECMKKAKAIDDDIQRFEAEAPVSASDTDEEKGTKLKHQKWLQHAKNLNKLGVLHARLLSVMS